MMTILLMCTANDKKFSENNILILISNFENTIAQKKVSETVQFGYKC